MYVCVSSPLINSVTSVKLSCLWFSFDAIVSLVTRVNHFNTDLIWSCPYPAWNPLGSLLWSRCHVTEDPSCFASSPLFLKLSVTHTSLQKGFIIWGYPKSLGYCHCWKYQGQFLFILKHFLLGPTSNPTLYSQIPAPAPEEDILLLYIPNLNTFPIILGPVNHEILPWGLWLLGQNENSESPRPIKFFIHITFSILPIHYGIRYYPNSSRFLCLEASVPNHLDDLKPTGWYTRTSLGDGGGEGHRSIWDIISMILGSQRC